jgi:GrpB-like predicted nucleotidyltransferase (UPF0157 family)
MRVEVVAYDPDWKSDFKSEANRITQALESMVVVLHHIGSTAIPGIFSKPIIDILLEVNEISVLDCNTAAFDGLGYEALGEFGIPGRRYYRKDDASGNRTHQIHAFRRDHPDVFRHLAFRDYMIAHPKCAKTYGRLKLRARAPSQRRSGSTAEEHPHDNPVR